MSFSGLFAIGVSGVNAYAASLEAISSNIANSQTDGYKRAGLSFSTLLGGSDSALNTAVGAERIGAGVATTAASFVAQQGAIIRTDEPGDIALAGQGFLVVRDDPDASANDARLLFTRSSGFRADTAGNLVNAAGLYLQGLPVGADGTATIAQTLAGLETVSINRNAAGRTPVGFDIDAEGYVSARYDDGETARIYRLPIALFRNTSALERQGDTTFLNSSTSGDAILRAAGDRGAAAIEARARETSTVEIGEEFGRLIETQRAYSTNTRVISIADELWRTLIDTAA